MGAREWLEHVRECASQLDGLHHELQALEDARRDCLPWQCKGSSMYGSMGGTHSDPTATEAQAREDLDEQIARVRMRYEECVAVVGRCGEVLMRMADSLGRRHAKVIECYYIDRAATWSEVAWEMGLSRSTVVRMRDDAVAWIDDDCKLWSASPRLTHRFG